MTGWQATLAREVGPIGEVRRLGGGAWWVEAGGRRVVAKVGPGVLDEADGLRQLGGVPGSPPVPEVVYAKADLLVTAAVEQVPRRPGHDESLGRALALLHAAPFPYWGGGSSWIGACRVDPALSDQGAAFYGARLLELARRCGLEGLVTGVVDRLGELLPPDGPALVHGDLWWGNVLSGAHGRSWLIDPSVHGGHPEEDLAMLALFGAVPDLLLAVYREVRPLEPGWRERIALVSALPPSRPHRALRRGLPGPGRGGGPAICLTQPGLG